MLYMLGPALDSVLMLIAVCMACTSVSCRGLATRGPLLLLVCQAGRCEGRGLRSRAGWRCLLLLLALLR